jgi:hypothetical protein
MWDTCISVNLGSPYAGNQMPPIFSAQLGRSQAAMLETCKRLLFDWLSLIGLAALVFGCKVAHAYKLLWPSTLAPALAPSHHPRPGFMGARNFPHQESQARQSPLQRVSLARTLAHQNQSCGPYIGWAGWVGCGQLITPPSYRACVWHHLHAWPICGDRV